jgi:predicted nucleotidyltransferase
MKVAAIAVDRQALAAFCRAHHIRWLALFGSALHGEFAPESDVDVLVEFEPSHVPGFLGLARLARELETLFGGRAVDLRTAAELSRYFREEVLRQAEVVYAQE